MCINTLHHITSVLWFQSLSAENIGNVKWHKQLSWYYGKIITMKLTYFYINENKGTIKSEESRTRAKLKR